MFPPKGLFKNNDDLKALHLAITILNLVTITTLTIITNYNTFKLNQETFTQLSKLAVSLYETFKNFNLRIGAKLLQSLIEL